ncbi:unnamed protein product [Ixodes pacificus]
MGGEIGALQATVRDQANTILQLKAELNDRDQQHRLPNMEIQGVPFTPKESLGKVLCDLASKIGLPQFRTSDVLSIRRLPNKKDKPDGVPPLLVSFASVDLKEQWMGCRGRLRDLNRDGALPKLFFNDDLTRANRELFWIARSRGKEMHYRYIWTKNAQIYARKAEGSPLLRINSVADTENIV